MTERKRKYFVRRLMGVFILVCVVSYMTHMFKGMGKVLESYKPHHIWRIY